MEHYTTRATIIPQIVELIIDNFNLSEREALDGFYRSATGAAFADNDTGLYGQSVNFIFGLYKKEIEENTAERHILGGRNKG